MQGKKETLSVIKAARLRTGLSQSEFGRLVTVSNISVQRYELGLRKIPRTYFERCKNILRTDIVELDFLLKAFKASPVFFVNDKLNLNLSKAS